MVKKRVIMAAGHEDLGTDLSEQKAAVARTVKVIADFVQEGWQVTIVHSNALRVGMIHIVTSEFGKQHDRYNKVPMSVCSAMNQSYVGYDLRNGIRAELVKRGICEPVSTVLTQVIMGPCDEAFYTPVKVIGRMMTTKEIEEEEAKGNHVREVEGGFRRIVASLHSIAIAEIDAIKALLDAGQLVIVCGGDDIPVMGQGYSLGGANAIIEKNLATDLLAKKMNTDVMMIFTNVEDAALNCRTKGEQPINRMTIDQAKDYINQGQSKFASMLPEITASADFLGSGEGRKAIITTLDKAKESLKGNGGAVIE